MASGAQLNGAAMRRKLLRFQEKFPSEVAQALYVEAEIEVKEVKRRTPVDRGHLRSSVHQVGPTIVAGVVSTEIVAGGPSAPYAVYVHENPDAIHPVGQWKFLESVVLESRLYIAARVAKRLMLRLRDAIFR